MSFKQWIEPELLNQVDWIKKRNFIRGLWGLIPFNIKKITKKGLNIITFKEAIINYFNFNIKSNLDVRSLNYKPKHSKSPQGKMIFYFEKL